MLDENTTIKIKESTKSRLREARRKLSYILDMTLMSDDATLNTLIDEWERMIEDSKPVASVENNSSIALPASVARRSPMVQARLNIAEPV